jgi:hypothetical protein
LSRLASNFNPLDLYLGLQVCATIPVTTKASFYRDYESEAETIKSSGRPPSSLLQPMQPQPSKCLQREA